MKKQKTELGNRQEMGNEGDAEMTFKSLVAGLMDVSSIHSEGEN